jgi:hypothetical protein
LGDQLRQAHEIVGGGGEGEGESGLGAADEAGLAQSRDRLDPPERLFDPFTDALALVVASVSRPSMAEKRALRATCGRTFIVRSSSTKSAAS